MSDIPSKFDRITISAEYLGQIEDNSGLIYDLCGTALAVVGDGNGSREKELRRIIEEIMTLNSRVHDAPFHAISDAELEMGVERIARGFTG